MPKITIGAIVILIFGAYFLYYAIFLEKDSSGMEKLFSVEKGNSLFDIARNLEEQEIINHRFFFNTYVLSKKMQRDLKAGHYNLSSSMTIPEIAEQLYLGKIAAEKIQIIEGWNIDEIALYLEERELVASEEFRNAVYFSGRGTQDESAPHVEQMYRGFSILEDKPSGLSLEGYLFSDTYQIQRGIRAEDLVRVMLQNLEDKVTPSMMKEIRDQGKSFLK